MNKLSHDSRGTDLKRQANVNEVSSATACGEMDDKRGKAYEIRENTEVLAIGIGQNQLLHGSNSAIVGLTVSPFVNE